MSEMEPTKSRMSKGMRIVFGLSLALNLLVVGAISGAFLRHGGPPGRDDISPAGISRLLYGELPKEERRALRKELRGKMDRSVFRNTRIQEQLDASLRAESFDPDAVRALFERRTVALQAGQSAMRESWLELVSGMSQAERIAYADRVQEAIQRKRKRGPGGKSDKP